jgi:hypothetical protein
MELEATDENIPSNDRMSSLIKVMEAKDNEVSALQNRITVLQDRLKFDLTTP